MNEKISFENDIIGVKTRKIVFSFFGFRCYKLSPPVISHPNRYQGFDIHVGGKFNSELSFVACYSRIGKRYKMVKIYALNCETKRNLVEAEMTLRYVESAYLVKQCRLEIVPKEKTD